MPNIQDIQWTVEILSVAQFFLTIEPRFMRQLSEDVSLITAAFYFYLYQPSNKTTVHITVGDDKKSSDFSSL